MTGTKAIEDQTNIDRVKEARAALRGANTHVVMILNQIDKQSKTMTGEAELLRRVASALGDTMIKHPYSGEIVTVKKILHETSANLANMAVQ